MSLLQCHHVRRHVPKKGDPFKSGKIMYLRALGAGIAGNLSSEFWAYASLISGQIHRAMPQNFTLPVSYLIRTWSLPKPILTQCSLLKSSMFYPFLGQRLALASKVFACRVYGESTQRFPICGSFSSAFSLLFYFDVTFSQDNMQSSV